MRFSTDVVVHDKADGLSISLNARFVFSTSASSDQDASGTLYALSGRVPDDMDVILQSDLIVSLSGILNRVKVAGRDMQTSAIAQHLHNYLRTNGEQLGLRMVAGIFMDDDDGHVRSACPFQQHMSCYVFSCIACIELTVLPSAGSATVSHSIPASSVILSPTRPILDGRLPCVRLHAIELLYSCRTPHALPQPHCLTPEAFRETGMSAAADPFSPHAFLPLVSALDRIVEKFVALQLVRRFPLIFGHWRERFDAEVLASMKISRAITDIIARSPHTAFRKQCGAVLKTLRNKSIATANGSMKALRTLMPPVASEDREDEDRHTSYSKDHVEILSQAMERLLKRGTKPVRYKGVVAEPTQPGKKASDDNFQLSNCSHDATTFPYMEEGKWPGIGPDARDSVELSFDEDAETVGGSEDGLDWFPRVDTDAVDGDMWVSDSAESSRGGCAPLDLEDSDDFWDSSQSTLDDSWPETKACSRRMTAIGDSPRHGVLDEDHDEWFEDLNHALKDSDTCFERSSDYLLDDGDSSIREQGSDHSFSNPREGRHLLSRGLETGYVHGFAHPTLDAESTSTTFPIDMDDDLWGDSRAFLPGTASSSLSPMLAEVSEPNPESGFGFGFSAVPVPRSSDGNSTSSSLAELQPGAFSGESSTEFILDDGTLLPREFGAIQQTYTMGRRDLPRAATYVNDCVRSSSTDQDPDVFIDSDGDEWVGRCQEREEGGERGGCGWERRAVWAHDRNEGSLVAVDANHATAIRAGQEAACVEEEGVVRGRTEVGEEELDEFLTEPEEAMDLDLDLDAGGFDVDYSADCEVLVLE